MQDLLPKEGKQKKLRHGGTGVRTTQALTGHQNDWELDKYAFYNHIPITIFNPFYLSIGD